jgi:hypothetical protein
MLENVPLFRVTVIVVVATFMIITLYFYHGLRSYHAKLLLIPRNCLRCGLPVLEHEKVRNDETSINPLVLLRHWYQVYRRKHQDTSDTSITEITTTRTFGDHHELEERKLKRDLGMSQVKTPLLGVFRSVHIQCPSKNVLSGSILERTIRSNLRVWQARVKLRMNYLTYRNKCLKLYCWMALFMYPTVSKNLLMMYNCQEIGNVWYLAQDRRIVCYDSTWAVFGVVATIGVVIWVIGVPGFFWLLIRLAQDRGVASRVRLLRRQQFKRLRQKWLKEMLADYQSKGIHIRNIENMNVQDEHLAKYMKKKNLNVCVRTMLNPTKKKVSNTYLFFFI